MHLTNYQNIRADQMKIVDLSGPLVIELSDGIQNVENALKLPDYRCSEGRAILLETVFFVHCHLFLLCKDFSRMGAVMRICISLVSAIFLLLLRLMLDIFKLIQIHTV